MTAPLLPLRLTLRTVIPSSPLLILGTLPESGTICRTENTGLNNIFVKGSKINQSASDSKTLKIALCLGLGLGIPLVGVLCFLAGIRSVRSRTPKETTEHDHDGHSIKDIKLADPYPAL